MTEKIQMAEENWMNALKECFPVAAPHVILEEIKNNLYEKGYIKKSAVEEAEEMYQIYITNHNRHLCDRTFLHKLIEMLHEVIQELKNEPR